MSRQRPLPRDRRCREQRPRSVFPTGHLDVTMAATNLENQLQSAQKNLLFLQREHASTLKGLHAEIRRLQRHCTGTGAPTRGGGRGAGPGGRSDPGWCPAEPEGRVALPWLARDTAVRVRP